MRTGGGGGGDWLAVNDCCPASTSVCNRPSGELGQKALPPGARREGPGQARQAGRNLAGVPRCVPLAAAGLLFQDPALAAGHWLVAWLGMERGPWQSRRLQRLHVQYHQDVLMATELGQRQARRPSSANASAHLAGSCTFSWGRDPLPPHAQGPWGDLQHAHLKGPELEILELGETPLPP